MKSSDFHYQDMKKQMTLFIFSGMISAIFILNNTRPASPDFSSGCAPRRVTYFMVLLMSHHNEKKIVTNENSSVTVVPKMTSNNTRPASDSSAPRRVTYFRGA